MMPAISNPDVLVGWVLQDLMRTLATLISMLVTMPAKLREIWFDTSCGNHNATTPPPAATRVPTAPGPAYAAPCMHQQEEGAELRRLMGSLLVTRSLVLLLVLAVHAPGDGREVKQIISRTLSVVLQPEQQQQQRYYGSQQMEAPFSHPSMYQYQQQYQQQRHYHQQQYRHQQSPSRLDSFNSLMPAAVLKIIP
jgi:hypothetical protein